MTQTIEISRTKKGYTIRDTDYFTVSDFDRKGNMIGNRCNWFFGVDFERAGLQVVLDEQIHLVLADGLTRSLTLNSRPQTAVVSLPSLPKSMQPCSKCHTYCDGDCSF